MYKTFKYKEVEIEVKTTQLNNGIAFFGDTDVQGALEQEYNEIKYDYSDKGLEEFLLLIYKRLASKGIKANSIKSGNLKYTGIIMTEITKQSTLA